MIYIYIYNIFTKNTKLISYIKIIENDFTQEFLDLYLFFLTPSELHEMLQDKFKENLHPEVYVIL